MVGMILKISTHTNLCFELLKIAVSIKFVDKNPYQQQQL
jgi:hypothetical protein